MMRTKSKRHSIVIIVDVAFGPTFSTYDYDLDVGAFYKWWDSSVGKDPRNMENSDIRSKLWEWEWLQKNPQITCCLYTRRKPSRSKRHILYGLG